MSSTALRIFLCAAIVAIGAAARADEPQLLTGDWGGLRPQLEKQGIALAVQEQSEIWGDLAGGARRGAVYDGLTAATLALDLEKLLGWPGASIQASGLQIHGRSPSANRVGSLQLVSGIEATRDTKLFDLWLQQKLWDGRLEIRAGQEGADEELMLSRYGASFLNSAFGFPALTALDLPSGGPAYPLATPFARVKFQATEELAMVAAIFNGDPAPVGLGDPQLRDAGGTAFRTNDHLLGFTEFQYATGQGKGELPATYKLGAWYSSSPFADQRFDTGGLPLASPLSNGIPRTHSPGYAVYGVIDQRLWRPADGDDDAGISGFLRVMGAPGSFNPVDWFVQGGLHWRGALPGRGEDVIGLAASYIGISPAARGFSRDRVLLTGGGAAFRGSETVIEATYLYKATDWLSLQPDLQFLINPNPTAAAPLANAVVAGMRATIQF